MSIPVNKLGWMAGVIDLRGKVTRKRHASRRTDQIVMYVESSNYGIIVELGSLTGTKPELKKAERLKDWMRKGCTEHCPEAHIHVLNDANLTMPPTARWTLSGAAAAVVLHNVMPYILAQYQWQITIEEIFEKTILEGQGSGATTASIRRLHELGWEIPEEFAEVVADPLTLVA